MYRSRIREAEEEAPLISEIGHKSVSEEVLQEVEPPEGGWGWVVVVAFAIANIFVFSYMSAFTLMFKDRFNEINLSATDVSLIININAGIGVGIGFAIGPLLKILGYRKMSFVGGGFLSLGLILTSWARSFTHLLITYGIMTAAGMEICLATFALAVSTYFKVKRNEAFGVGLTLAGIGFIVFPQLVRIFLELYGITGCCLILGGISLNIFVAAILLQPVKYHVKNKNLIFQQNERILEVTKSITDLTSDFYREAAIDGKDSFDENLTDMKEDSTDYKLVHLFDLNLLRDLRFLNLIIGFSLVIFAETNFSLLTPLILAEESYTNTEIANFLSLVGIIDIISRFLAPYVGDLLNFSVLGMCSLSLLVTVIGRFCFLCISNYQQLLLVGVGLGVAKGFRYVYLTLIVPAYLPLDRLPAASGIQTVIKGFVMIVLGPLLGIIKDSTGSYNYCITFINLAIFLTLCLWLSDIVQSNCRDRQNK